MGKCVLCEEQITTPLSPERLGEQIATWINEEHPKELDNFRKVSDELLCGSNTKNDLCIINRKPMHVCAFCYTEHIFKWFITTKPTWDLVRQFLLHFDYDTSKYGIEVRLETKIYT